MRSLKSLTARMASMFNVDGLRQQIEALIRNYPDLAEDETLRADTLEGATDIKQVLTALFEAADDNKTLMEAITLRVQTLTARKARLLRRVEFLRDLMLRILQSADQKKIELAAATLLQRATQPQIVGEINADALPDDLVRIKREPDRVKIREALLARREVPGLSLSNAPPTLSINVR